MSSRHGNMGQKPYIQSRPNQFLEYGPTESYIFHLDLLRFYITFFILNMDQMCDIYILKNLTSVSITSPDLAIHICTWCIYQFQITTSLRLIFVSSSTNLLLISYSIISLVCLSTDTYTYMIHTHTHTLTFFWRSYF